MNFIAWNCRGLGNTRTVQELCGLATLYRPKVIFLCETRIKATRVRNLVWRLAKDSVGLSGGIALFWDESVDVSLLSQGDRYFDVLIKESPDQAPWRGTFVYGEPRVENRHLFWDIFRNLGGVWDGPWMAIGDFNEAMWQHEHLSETPPRPERQMMDFREVLSHCDLRDIGFCGLPWTYNNNRDGSANVRVRLDRGVANPDWCDHFPNANIHHLCSSRSDHMVLILKLQGESCRTPIGNTFRYEAMWERAEGLNGVVESLWGDRPLYPYG
ncbi:hypothetical protein BDA96_08G006200 [Sorghum bicolor]|uniref:Endonuclease/exonuclease/phosphatase domain-containing protein n=1 Tax=Sorghum bicolor TaxID=4558 RepID=A0A921QD89_SORBI|nr:hypothetical protein BDA96_08G006200 [Sorghum bicolor]